MINLKKASLLVVAGLMLAPAAFAAEFNNVVKDSNGHVVKNSFDNCVVSSFTSKDNGCQEGLKGLTKELRNVYFDFNKSTLNKKEKAKLDTVSKIILGSKQVESVDIVGYADKIGKPSYNKALSAKRAGAVKKYLTSKGLKTRKLTVEALGEAHPVTKCDDKLAKPELIACLAEDRRVEIKVNLKK